MILILLTLPDGTQELRIPADLAAALQSTICTVRPEGSGLVKGTRIRVVIAGAEKPPPTPGHRPVEER